MKPLATLAALLVVTFALGSCQNRETSPMQPVSDNDVAIAARLSANHPLPTASRVRARLVALPRDTSAWTDIAYQSGGVLDLGRVARGSSIVLDVRAYSVRGTNDTVWKWFSRTQAKADAQIAIQLVDAQIDTIPAALGIATSDPSGQGVVLPTGSRYTLDGNDPSQSPLLSGGTPVVVPKGAYLRARIRFLVPGTTDYLDGDTLRVNGAPIIPPVALDAPRFLLHGLAVPGEVAVGDTIRLVPAPTAKLAYTTDGSAPTCGSVLQDSDVVAIGASLAGKTFVLTAISCKDAEKSGATQKSIAVANLGVAPRKQFGSLPGFDSASSTAKIPWSQTVALDIPPRTTVQWKLSVVRDGSDINPVTWASLGLPGPDDGTGAAIQVDASLLRYLPPTDSLATVLASAILFDSVGAAQDTVRLRWTIQVPYVLNIRPAKPTTTFNSGTLPEELTVGAIIMITADTGSRLAFSTDGSEPSCANAILGGYSAWSIDSARSGNTVRLKAVSCRDTSTSLVDSHTVKIAALGERTRTYLQVPNQYDAATATAQMPWTDGVSLLLPSRTSLLWNLRVIGVSAQPAASDWNALGLPTALQNTGSGSVVQVKPGQLADLAPTDSILTVLASAILFDSVGLPLDTVRFRWNIVVPPVSKPVLSATRGLGRVVFSWPVTSSTQSARAWAWIGDATDSIAIRDIAVGMGKDSFAVALGDGQRARVSVVSIDAATGRASARSTWESTALLPPQKPKFQVSNTDSVEGTVEIVLDASTRAEAGVTWTVGYASSSAIGYTAGDIDDFGRWTAKLNAGTYSFGVRASRDGEVRDSVTSIAVRRTKGFSPASVQGLAVRRTDSSTIVWKWTRVPSRSYRVFVLRGTAFATALDTSTCLAADVSTVGNQDSFLVADLVPGAKVSIAVVALAGSDSANGNAQPSFTNLTGTLVPPPTPTVNASNSGKTIGEVTISVPNFDAASVWSLGVDLQGGTNFTWTTFSTSVVTRTYALNGTANFRVQAVRDGYTKATSVALPVKNSSILAPAAPYGMHWIRKELTLELRWTSLPGHTYRLFWDNSTANGNLDTASSNKLNKQPLDSVYTFTTTAGQTVRVALQTLSAPDSTKPSTPTFDRQTALATIDPVGSISGSFNATTKIATFTWPAVSGAVKYGYTSNLQGSTTLTNSPQASIAYPVGTTDVSVTVWAVNADGVLSTTRTSSVHIPSNVGSTNLVLWPTITRGTTLSIEGRSSTDITGTAPDSVVVWLRNGAGIAQIWRMGYSALASFRADAVLDSAAMNAGSYRLQAQFRWTSGSLQGDSTSVDSRVITGFAGAVPKPVFRVAAGKTIITVQNYNSILPAPSGWTAVVLADVQGSWIDILDNDEPSIYPSLRSGNGTGTYPLGTNRLMVYYTSGQDTSVVRVVDVGYGDSIVHAGHTYPIVQYGTRRWISRPMNTPAAGDYCSDGTVAADCGTAGRLYTWLEATGRSVYPDAGNNPSQGVCPQGWRIPNTDESYALLVELAPGWNWDTKETYPMKELLTRGRFELQGQARETDFVGYSAMWTSTTGFGGNLQYHDLLYTDYSFTTGYEYVTAYSRYPGFDQQNLAFCIDDVN